MRVGPPDRRLRGRAERPSRSHLPRAGRGHRRDPRQHRPGRLSRQHRLLPGPHQRRAQSSPSSPPSPGSDSRPAAMSPSPGPPRTRSSSAIDRSARWRSPRMSLPYDGSSVDLEKELDPLHGRAARLAPPAARGRSPSSGRPPRWRRSIAACTTGGVRPTPSPTASPAASVAPRPPRRRRERPSTRRADADAHAGRRAVHLQLDRVHRRNTSSTIPEEVRRQGHARLLLEHRRGLRQARQRRRRLRRVVPDLGRHPGVQGRRAPSSSSTSRCSRTSSTSGRNGPTRTTTRATPTRCRTCGGRPASATTPVEIKDTLTSSKALWDPRWAKHIAMLDDWQEVFGLTLIQLGLRRQHVEHRPDRPGARAARAAEAARPRLQHQHHDDDEQRRQLDRPDLGRGHLQDPGREREDPLLHPGRGRRPRLRHDGHLLRAPSTRSPRTCSSTTCSTRRSAPRTRTSSTTWARMPPRSSTSTRRSSPTRASTRTRRSSRSCRS